MKGALEFFQDNAMFYKDITQWLRNRTFGSLFFGLLLLAEMLSLFIIAGSDEISEPGVAMFYILYMVLFIYALVIAFMGNGLTAREFVNRTFELYELSGMSLERMVGGKLLSMLYQFAFGFFCLVPFMFFAYFLGGLDFFEMLVGAALALVLSVPLYLMALTGALIGRYKQVTVLTRLASGFGLGVVIIMSFVSFFSNEPLLREMVQGCTTFVKLVFSGDDQALAGLFVFVFLYVIGCLLLFYFCCNSISRETDSREIPIKVLTTALLLGWIGFFLYMTMYSGHSQGNFYRMTVPIYLTLLGLGLVCYYNRLGVPPIVVRRYSGATGFRRMLYWLFQPGMRGGIRTVLFLLAVAAAGLVALMFVAPMGFISSGSSGSGSLVPYSSTSLPTEAEFWNALSLLVQVPWFLTIPYLFYIRGRELRFNFPAQRALVMATWVVVGVAITIYLAWTRSSVFGSGTARGLSGTGDVVITTLLSPLPSMAGLDSRDFVMQGVGPWLRLGSGVVGAMLMVRHLWSVSREDVRLAMEAERAGGDGVAG